MKHFNLIRVRHSDEGSFGVFVSSCLGFLSNSAELPWRDNEGFVSCIPTGVYTAKVQHSPKFGRDLYRLEDKQTSPRSAILMHEGTWAGDRKKGLKYNFDGCIGLGKGYSDNLQGQQAILNSATALREFMEFTNGEDITITITDLVQPEVVDTVDKSLQELTRDTLESLGVPTGTHSLTLTWDSLLKVIPWVKGIDSASQGVVLALAKLIGVNGLLTFSNMLSCLRYGRSAQASVELRDSAWARKNPEMVKRFSTQLATGRWYV